MIEDNDNELNGRSFDELMADDSLTEKKLQEELNKYAKAFQQEYEVSLQKAPDNVEEYTRDFFKKNVPSAAAQIVHLSNNAESESVRLKASTIVIREALADARADGDPIKDLLNDLSKIPTATQDKD